jgi:N-acylglucosamine 2-epimerase
LKNGEISDYIRIYRDGLLNDTIPFWMKHSVDDKFGGFMFCLDRDGSVIDTDKGMWQNCRFTWMLSTLYNKVEKRKEWLDLARHGIEFIDRHGFDHDGRMFFQVNREGKPIRKRRYVFTETFASIAYAAYAKASGNGEYEKKARDLFDLVIRYSTTPGLIPPKYTDTRPSKGMGLPMITIATAQELRENLADSSFSVYIDSCVKEIGRDFINEEFKAVMETVGINGEFIDHFDGRTLNPGHAIEGAWFILNEARMRDNDPGLVRMGTKMLDWMWEIGWDKEYGGIFYFRDVKGLPVQEYWHDMKFWWPQNETIIATLLAYRLTGDEKYSHWHRLIHDWAYKHFPDPKFGEWYGYLHRDGRISVPLKGNIWKGPFHLPRMQLFSWLILEEILSERNPE